MKLKRITALLSGAAVLMTSVTGGCFSVEADQTEAEQIYESTEVQCYEAATKFLLKETAGSEAATDSSVAALDSESMKEGADNKTSGTEGQPGRGSQTVSESGTENHSETVTEQGSEKGTEPGMGSPQTENDLNQAESSSEGGLTGNEESETIPQYSDETESTDKPGDESETAAESETGTEAGCETESITEQTSETEQESEPSSGSETELASESESEAVSEEEEETEAESESETEAFYSEDSYYYNGSYWDPSWYFKRDFRFSQVNKQYALAQGSRSNRIYERPDQKSTIVGEVPFYGLVYVLKSIGGWSYVESGDVRGFIPSFDLQIGSDTTQMVELIEENGFETATPDVEIADNSAFTFTQTTTQDVIADKDSALVLTEGSILEYPKDNSRAVGEVKSGSLVYVLAKAQNEAGWYYVESGDVRGFMKASDLFYGFGSSVSDILFDMGEGDSSGSAVSGSDSSDSETDISGLLAEQLIDPKDNRSLYYSLKSTKMAADEVGEEIAEYAASFAGKIPYIWGGTSLSYGADCSGFVQSVFASFGISVPRTAQEQGVSGEVVSSVDDAQPGDVVYWGSGPHVGIYLGNGKVVECAGHSYNTAANPGRGPEIQSIGYMPVTSIRRYIILQDDNDGIAQTGARTDATDYSQEQLELIWAIVAQEDNGSYQGALAVISSAMNRTESSRWGFEGGNALSQLTAQGQYCYSMDSYWKPRLHGNVPDYVKQAVYDCLKRGIRNHNCTSFRSTKGKTTGANAVRIGGNWFFGS